VRRWFHPQHFTHFQKKKYRERARSRTVLDSHRS
jgi:hypothetical protein